MKYGNKAEGVNVHNDISMDINRGIRRVPRPSLKLIGEWRVQWANSDAVIHMTFEEYILEDRMASLFVQIENIFTSMKRILKHSVTLDEFRTNMERYMSL